MIAFCAFQGAKPDYNTVSGERKGIFFAEFTRLKFYTY